MGAERNRIDEIDQRFQSRADWQKQVVANLRTGDVEMAKEVAAKKPVDGVRPGQMGLEVGNMLLMRMGREAEQLMYFLEEDPVVDLLAEATTDDDEFEALFSDKAAMKTMVDWLVKDGKLDQDFNFELWWGSIPKHNLLPF